MKEERYILLFLLGLYLQVLPTNTAEECGIVHGQPQAGRIVGGYPVGYYKYPWFAALMRGGNEVYCGATLFKKQWLVTAAHCYRQWLPHKGKPNTTLENIFQIKMGVNDRCKAEKTQKTFTVKKVIVHENYQKKDPYYDIALLELKEPTDDFMPACLPEKELNTNTRGKDCTVQGFGNMKYGDNREPCEMKEARILIYDDETCKKMLKAEDEDPKEFLHAFCAGYLEGGIDACQGDSGGPLLIEGADKRQTLLGVTSFGFECAKPKDLGIYTDVSHYLSWIDERAGGLPGGKPAKPSKPDETGGDDDEGGGHGGPYQAVILQIMNKHKQPGPTNLEIINSGKNKMHHRHPVMRKKYWKALMKQRRRKRLQMLKHRGQHQLYNREQENQISNSGVHVSDHVDKKEISKGHSGSNNNENNGGTKQHYGKSHHGHHKHGRHHHRHRGHKKLHHKHHNNNHINNKHETKHQGLNKHHSKSHSHEKQANSKNHEHSKHTINRNHNSKSYHNEQNKAHENTNVKTHKHNNEHDNKHHSNKHESSKEKETDNHGNKRNKQHKSDAKNEHVKNSDFLLIQPINID